MIPSKNKLKCWQRNIREIYMFSDTDLLEATLSIVMIIINPISMYRIPATPLWWAGVGIAAGISLLYGLVERNLAIRYWSIRAIWTYLLVILVQCGLNWNINTNIAPYVIQLIIVWLVLWKTKKQLDFYNRKGKCSKQ